MEELTEQEKERLAANPHARGDFLGALNLDRVSNQLGEPARLLLYSRALTVVTLPDDRVVAMLSESEKFSSAQILLEILNEWKTQHPEEATKESANLAKLETYLSGWQANFAVTATKEAKDKETAMARAAAAAPYGKNEPSFNSWLRKEDRQQFGKELRKRSHPYWQHLPKKRGGRRRKSRRKRKTRRSRKRRRKRRRKTRRRRKRRR